MFTKKATHRKGCFLEVYENMTKMQSNLRILEQETVKNYNPEARL